MSVTFAIEGRPPYDEEGAPTYPPELFLNLSNVNAGDFLRWLGSDLYSIELCGSRPARELAALCRRRLWPERHGQGDGGMPEVVECNACGEVRFIDFGRPAGRLAEYAERLLRLAEAAGEAEVTWG
jgi:hypothetical protein